MSDFENPWICFECGRKHGKANFVATTFHNAKCGWCGQAAGVTHYRNYGYPKNPSSESAEQ